MSSEIDGRNVASEQPHTVPDVNWLTVLNRLSRKVNLAPGEVEKTLQELLRELTEETGASAAAIWTPEANTDFLMTYASHGLSDRFLRFFNNTDRVKVGNGLVGEVMQKRTTKHFSSFSEYKEIGVTRWLGVVETEGIEAILSVPLFVGEELYGTFNIYYFQEHAFTDPEILTAETLANQIAVIFENKNQSERLVEDSRLYKKQRDELISIQTVVRSVDSTIHTKREEAIEKLSQYIAETYKGFGIMILHGSHEDVLPSLAGSHNISVELQEYITTTGRDKPFSKLIDVIYRDKQPVMIDRVFTHEYIEKDWATILSKERIMSLSAFPLMVHERVVGTFVVYYDHLHTFSEDEVSVLTTLGQFLAVSLENVTVFNSLLTAKRKTESMIEGLKDGLVVFDLDGQVMDLNPAAALLLGLDRQAVDQLSSGATATRDIPTIAHVESLAIPAYETIETTIKTPEERILQITHIPLKDDQFEDVHAMRILHDVTEEYRTQEMKANFVGTATHQMRTPLTSIGWGLDVLHSEDAGEINEEQKSMLAKLMDTNSFVLSLVNTLLNVSRVEHVKTSNECDRINLCMLLKDLIKNESIAIQKKDLTFTVNCDDPVMPILGSKTDLALAFQNLIENAIKYTQDSGLVEVSLQQTKTEILVAIKDTGIGISQEDQRLLFSKFFRGKNAVLVETDGSGLGLFLTREIVKAHGGTVTVTSELDQGATFNVTLPKDRAFCREK